GAQRRIGRAWAPAEDGHGGCGARAHAELLVDVLEVFLDGADAEVEERRDLAVFAAGGDVLEHLELSRRPLGSPFFGRARPFRDLTQGVLELADACGKPLARTDAAVEPRERWDQQLSERTLLVGEPAPVAVEQEHRSPLPARGDGDRHEVVDLD